MPRIRRGAQAGLAELGEIFPAQTGIALQHRPGQRRLDRQPFFRQTVVQPAQPTVGRHAGIGGKAGAGNHQDSLGPLQRRRGALDRRIHACLRFND
ncbi:hypothetical protein D3C80_1834120 [compost metagenome]